jgi:PAT family beta-lactamase induction signal transducer AmpG
LSEAQLLKMEMPFLKDLRTSGGLELATDQVGWVNVIGISALLTGGVLGGVLISRHGLRAWLWPMVIIMHAPDVVYVYLSSAQPHQLAIIAAGISLEQFGYGFGFSAFMLYMMYIARGNHQTAHYAIFSGIALLGLMLAGMWSGRLEEKLGYPSFFVWVLISTIPSFLATALIPLDREFGKRATVA